jgi:hypothetical protein
MISSTADTNLCRRIDLAYIARNRAASEWGKNYWDGVLSYLLRKANRLN